MEHEKLVAWFAQQDLLKVLDHAGHHGGELSFDAARLACRRAGDRIRELETGLAAYDRVSRRLLNK